MEHHILSYGAGCLVTQGLGDALGFLAEGRHPVQCQLFVHEAFSSEGAPARTRGPFAFGQYSDDTQLARELGLSLVTHRGWNPDDFAARVARLFAEETIVGRGRATEAAARRILAGVPWDQAGEPSPSAGNGAAMRAAPVGLYFPDPSERLRVADEQARVTHLDLRSRAAAIVVADAVALGLRGQWRGSVGGLRWMAARVEPLDPALARALTEGMPRWLTLPEEEAAAEIARAGDAPRGTAHQFEHWHGVSPFATPSVLYALYAWLRAPAQPEAVLARCVAVGGDVDTVAAMAGAMVGAHVGLDGLGARLTRWSERLNDRGRFGRAELAALGESLAR